jgi:hypothetical protein
MSGMYFLDYVCFSVFVFLFLFLFLSVVGSPQLMPLGQRTG